MSKERVTNLIKKNWHFMLLGCLTIFMHCFMIGSIPFGLHVDEIGMGYDAWSIANFGVDRYLKSYPVYLINFGGGQSALYCYVAVIFIKFFGLSVYTMRIPAIIFACLTVIFGIKIVKMNWPEDRRVWFVFLALYTILPYFTMSSRFGLDCNLMLGTSTVFLYFFLRAIQKQTYGSYVLAGLTGGIVLYSYVLSYLVMPIFLVLAIIYLIFMKKIKFKHLFTMGVVFGVVACPLIMVQIVNMFDLPEMKIGPFTITKLFFYRSSEISISELLPNSLKVVKSVFFYDVLEYNTFSEYYTLYWITIPFAVLGLCYVLWKVAVSIRKREFVVPALILFWVVAEFMVGCMLVGDTANTNKMNGIFFGILFLTLEGIWWVYSSGAIWRKGICYISVVIYLVCFGSFFHYYFFEYKTDRYPQSLFDHTYEEAYQYVETGKDGKLANRITYVISDLNNYMYFLVSSKTTPLEFDLLNNGPEYYQNYIFSPPSSFDPNAIYIVSQAHLDYLGLLAEQGFREEKKGTHFVCYRANLIE